MTPNTGATDATGRPSSLIATWSRTTLLLFGAGSVLALGTRALFERLLGSVPYALPSATDVLVIALFGSAAAAGFLAWSSEEGNDAILSSPSVKLRPSSILARFAVGLVLFTALQRAHDRRDELSDLVPSTTPLAEIEHRARLRPEHPASQLALGEAYYDAGRYAEARGPLETVRILTTGPRDFETMRYRDRTWQERVVPATPTNARASVLYALTRAHLASSIESALNHYREAYELGEHSREVTQPLVAALMKAERYEEVGQVLRRYREDRGIDTELAKVLSDAEAAQSTLSRARGWGADLPFDPAELVRSWERTVHDHPTDALAEASLSNAQVLAAMLGRAEGKQATFEAAVAHARRATLLAPVNAAIRAQLGRALTFAQHYQAADSAFTAASALDPALLSRPEYRDLVEYAHARATGASPGRELMLRLSRPPRP
jgi:tetratricopeptide (TPR) repeat protein